MRVEQSPLFARTVKKLSKKDKQKLDQQIMKLLKNPYLGKQKKGDLKNVFVYKFKLNTIEHLLDYKISKDLIELIMLGPHENYYRDLKKYIS
jgi:mRNA-degrading endonuclease RelE of RelBE toxin-antitoxin system